MLCSWNLSLTNHNPRGITNGPMFIITHVPTTCNAYPSYQVSSRSGHCFIERERKNSRVIRAHSVCRNFSTFIASRSPNSRARFSSWHRSRMRLIQEQPPLRWARSTRIGIDVPEARGAPTVARLPPAMRRASSGVSFNSCDGGDATDRARFKPAYVINTPTLSAFRLAYFCASLLT